jgi:hypothetical protein
MANLASLADRAGDANEAREWRQKAADTGHSRADMMADSLVKPSDAEGVRETG